MEGHIDYYSQVIANREKRINTWAVFWYATIFKHHGLCLSPYKTLLKNIGHDGSGVNCGIRKRAQKSISQNSIKQLPQLIEENISVVVEIKSYYNKGILLRKVKLFVKNFIYDFSPLIKKWRNYDAK